MLILVANLGSTSFKYRLLAMPEGRELARGGIDRIGSGQQSACFVERRSTDFQSVPGSSPSSDEVVRSDSSAVVDDHAAAVAMCLRQLSEGDNAPLPDASKLAGIGFKAVFAGSEREMLRVAAYRKALSDIKKLNDDDGKAVPPA